MTLLVPGSRTTWLALAAFVAVGGVIGCASLTEGDAAPDWSLADLAGQIPKPCFRSQDLVQIG